MEVTTMFLLSTILASVVLLVIFLIVLLGAYVYYSLVLRSIAKKTKTAHAWMAWVPLVRNYLFFREANLSSNWALFLTIFIPLAFYPLLLLSGVILSIALTVFYIWLWWIISERMGHPGWISLLLLVPILNIVIIGVIAWAGSSSKNTSAKKKSSSKPVAGKSTVSSKKTTKKISKPVTKKPVTKKKSSDSKASSSRTAKKATVKKMTKKSAVKKKK